MKAIKSFLRVHPASTKKFLPFRDLLKEREAIAALEFAMIAPIMVILLMGTICLGFYFTYLHDIQEMSAGAARASVAGLTSAERYSLAQQYVANAINQSSIFAANDVSVVTQISGSPATNYSVTVAYNLKDTPIPDIASIVGLPVNNVTHTSTIRFGGY